MLTHLGLREMGGFIENFNPKSISALNYLIYNLSKTYNVDLVISSARRDKMHKLLSLLHKEGLDYNKKIHKTPYVNTTLRGLQILAYLSDKPNKKNILAIDDDSSDITPYISESKVIKTCQANCSLRIEQVEKFLKDLENSNTQEL
ncbi:MAG: HAD domain-containing protein [Clostridia bacterium]|jgi:hypothetical protein